jgi:hypothetical protein
MYTDGRALRIIYALSIVNCQLENSSRTHYK